MTSFPGLISGYPEVAVDRFTGPCLRAQYFFLSHLHTDHMQGLWGPESGALLSVLAALPGRRLFCSRQSAALLAGWPQYAHLQPHLEPLDVGEPRQLADRLVVTALPAGHCVGSVMFLLEAGAGGTVLYTGDFRLGRGDLAALPALHLAAGRVKPLDALYADTTFCVAGRRELPSRRSSTERVTALVAEFLRAGPRHRVNIVCKARYGYEHLFHRLHATTGLRVHVPDAKYRLYARLPEIAGCLTTRPDETRLHSCSGRDACLAGGDPLRSVVVSTLFFFLKQSVDRIVHCVGEEEYRVLYSMHASLREVQEAVRYLRPKRVVPCVVPPDSSREAVVALLSQDAAERDDPADGGGARPLLPLPGRLLASDGRRERATVDRKRPLAEADLDQRAARSPWKAPAASPPRRERTPDTRPAWRSPLDSD